MVGRGSGGQSSRPVGGVHCSAEVVLHSRAVAAAGLELGWLGRLRPRSGEWTLTPAALVLLLHCAVDL